MLLVFQGKVRWEGEVRSDTLLCSSVPGKGAKWGGSCKVGTNYEHPPLKTHQEVTRRRVTKSRRDQSLPIATQILSQTLISQICAAYCMSVITTTLLKMHDPIRWSVFDECTFSIFYIYRRGNGGRRRLMSSLGSSTADDKPRLCVFCLCAPCDSVLRLPSTKGTGRKAACGWGWAAGRQWQMAARRPQSWLWGPEGKQFSLLWLCLCLYFGCCTFLDSVFWGNAGDLTQSLGHATCSATAWYL